MVSRLEQRSLSEGPAPRSMRVARTRRDAARTPAPQRPDAAQAAADAALERWEIVERIAEGATTEIFRARPAGSPAEYDAAYCLKRVKPAFADDPRAIATLRREARVGRKISNPHLVPVLEANVEDAPHYIVMPYLSGATLASLRRASPTAAVTAAIWFARQVAEALAALAAAGWMHGVVKPANIMISPEGHVTLLDLACARRPTDEDRSRIPALFGTPWYTAPEALVSSVRPDIRSDLYSLGVVLYELLTGRLPVAGVTAEELIAAHRHDEAAPLRSIVPDLPKRLADLTDELLAKEPLRRPQSPVEVVSRLAALEVAYFGEE